MRRQVDRVNACFPRGAPERLEKRENKRDRGEQHWGTQKIIQSFTPHQIQSIQNAIQLNQHLIISFNETSLPNQIHFERRNVVHQNPTSLLPSDYFLLSIRPGGDFYLIGLHIPGLGRFRSTWRGIRSSEPMKSMRQIHMHVEKEHGLVWGLTKKAVSIVIRKEIKKRLSKGRWYKYLKKGFRLAKKAKGPVAFGIALIGTGGSLYLQANPLRREPNWGYKEKAAVFVIKSAVSGVFSGVSTMGDEYAEIAKGNRFRRELKTLVSRGMSMKKARALLQEKYFPTPKPTLSDKIADKVQNVVDRYIIPSVKAVFSRKNRRCRSVFRGVLVHPNCKF